MTNRLPPDDELLSACFDGEVTAEERARVAASRAESSAVDAELAALGELSQLLKSLPREPAPPELCSAVLQQIQRKTLQAAPDTPPRRRWRSLREVGIFLSGAAVAAACTMLAVQLSTPQGLVPVASHDRFDIATPAATPATALSAWHDSPPARGVRLTEAAVEGPASDVAFNSVSRALDRKELFMMGRAVAVGATAPTALADADEDAVSPTEVGNVPQLAATAVPLTDVLPILANESESRISNLEVFSRNPERSVDGLQKILASNGVLFEAEESARAPAAKAGAAGLALHEASESEPQLPAVYVEAPTEPLARSLEQWAQQPELIGVRLRPPLELPLDAAAVADAKDGQRARRLDVEQLRLAYVVSNSGVTSGDEQPALREAPLSAVDAVKQNALETEGERLAESRMRAAYRTLPVPHIKTPTSGGQTPVAPLPEELSQLQRRFNVPLMKGVEAGKRSTASAQADRPLSEELLARQKLANYTANASQVRMLIVFQAAVAPPPATPATSPAPR